MGQTELWNHTSFGCFNGFSMEKITETTQSLCWIRADILRYDGSQSQDLSVKPSIKDVHF